MRLHLLAAGAVCALAACTNPCKAGESCPTSDESAATATVAYDWHGDFGPCRPDQLGNSQGSVFKGSGCGGGGPCEGYGWAFYPASLPFADRTCKFELSRMHESTVTAVLDDADCAALKCWLTSDVFLAGLDDGTPCGDGIGIESTELQLLGGESHARKFSLCTEEPFVSHRATLSAVLAKCFPQN